MILNPNGEKRFQLTHRLVGPPDHFPNMIVFQKPLLNKRCLSDSNEILVPNNVFS